MKIPVLPVLSADTMIKAGSLPERNVALHVRTGGALRHFSSVQALPMDLHLLKLDDAR
jgi:hypothetical protein